MKSTIHPFKKLMIGLLALGLTGGAFGQSAPGDVDWVRPFVDWSDYDKFLIKPLDISDVKVLKPVWEQDDPEEWEFEPGTGEFIQDMYMKEMTAAISGEHGFPVVDEDGPGVLQLEVEFLSITPYTKPGTRSADKDYTIKTLGSGDVVVSAEVRDAHTGELLWLVEGERQIGTEYKELSPENHEANLKATFNLWGTRLRELLTIAHNRASK